MPVTVFQCSAKVEDLACLGGFGQVGVGVEQGVGVGVLGEEGQHAAGALRARGHVVLVQRGVLAPVHDGVEVQVQHLAGGQAGGDGGLVQRGQELLLLGVLQAVGVGGQRGRLGQGGEPGEQRRAGVGGQIVHVGDPAGPGQLHGQQGQQVADRGDVAGAGVAGGGDQCGQVQGEQVGQRQQQPGHPGGRGGGQARVVAGGQGTGPGQVFAAGAAAGGFGPAPDPGQTRLGDDLADPGAVQPDALGGQCGGDLVDGVPLGAQGDDPGAGGVLAGCGFGAGAGIVEEVLCPGAEVGHGRVQPGGGVAEPGGHGRGGFTVEQVGTQCLVAGLRARGGDGEEFAARPGGLWGIR